MITDSNHACFAKMATCGLQEEVNIGQKSISDLTMPESSNPDFPTFLDNFHPHIIGPRFLKTQRRVKSIEPEKYF
jgi:hypothetical protein